MALPLQVSGYSVPTQSIAAPPDAPLIAFSELPFRKSVVTRSVSNLGAELVGNRMVPIQLEDIPAGPASPRHVLSTRNVGYRFHVDQSQRQSSATAVYILTRPVGSVTTVHAAVLPGRQILPSSAVNASFEGIAGTLLQYYGVVNPGAGPAGAPVPLSRSEGVARISPILSRWLPSDGIAVNYAYLHALMLRNLSVCMDAMCTGGSQVAAVAINVRPASSLLSDLAANEPEVLDGRRLYIPVEVRDWSLMPYMAALLSPGAGAFSRTLGADNAAAIAGKHLYVDAVNFQGLTTVTFVPPLIGGALLPPPGPFIGWNANNAVGDTVPDPNAANLLLQAYRALCLVFPCAVSFHDAVLDRAARYSPVAMLAQDGIAANSLPQAAEDLPDAMLRAPQIALGHTGTIASILGPVLQLVEARRAMEAPLHATRTFINTTGTLFYLNGMMKMCLHALSLWHAIPTMSFFGSSALLGAPGRLMYPVCRRHYVAGLMASDIHPRYTTTWGWSFALLMHHCYGIEISPDLASGFGYYTDQAAANNSFTGPSVNEPLAIINAFGAVWLREIGFFEGCVRVAGLEAVPRNLFSCATWRYTSRGLLLEDNLGVVVDEDGLDVEPGLTGPELPWIYVSMRPEWQPAISYNAVGADDCQAGGNASRPAGGAALTLGARIPSQVRPVIHITARPAGFVGAVFAPELHSICFTPIDRDAQIVLIPELTQAVDGARVIDLVARRSAISELVLGAPSTTHRSAIQGRGAYRAPGRSRAFGIRPRDDEHLIAPEEQAYLPLGAAYLAPPVNGAPVLPVPGAPAAAAPAAAAPAAVVAGVVPPAVGGPHVVVGGVVFANAAAAALAAAPAAALGAALPPPVMAQGQGAQPLAALAVVANPQVGLAPVAGQGVLADGADGVVPALVIPGPAPPLPAGILAAMPGVVDGAAAVVAAPQPAAAPIAPLPPLGGPHAAAVLRQQAVVAQQRQAGN